MFLSDLQLDSDGLTKFRVYRAQFLLAADSVSVLGTSWVCSAMY